MPSCTLIKYKGLGGKSGSHPKDEIYIKINAILMTVGEKWIPTMNSLFLAQKTTTFYLFAQIFHFVPHFMTSICGKK